MTMFAPTGARRPAMLIYTGVPGRSGEMIRLLEMTARSAGAESEGARKILSLLDIDRSSPSGSYEEVLLAMKSGYDGPPGHALLVVCGDVCADLSPKRLADLRRACLFMTPGLAIVGAYENERDLAALGRLGIERTVRIERFGVDLAPNAARAIKDVHEEAALIEQRRAEAQVKTQIIVNEGATQDGLLPNNGVIVFHANKGGTGKSTIASSVAYGLSLSRPVVLADWNSSGGFIHSHFSHWLMMPQNGGYDHVDQLFSERGLGRIARNLNHADMQIVSADHINDAVVTITDPKKAGWKLILLPGVRSQEDYEVGSASPGAKSMQLLITKFKWAEQLIDGLRRIEGGRGYVLVDTDTTRYAQLTRVPIRMADLLVIVVDGRDIAALEDEFMKTENLLSDPLTHFTGKLMIVVNQLYDGKMKVLAPEAPTFRQAEEIFLRLNAGRHLDSLEIVAVPFEPGLRTRAGRAGMPSLALHDNDSPLTSALMDIVNRINGSLSVTTTKKQKSFLPFGKKG